MNREAALGNGGEAAVEGGDIDYAQLEQGGGVGCVVGAEAI
jgi:hypothetical protein